jgi:iron complex outermembrane receptor protein
MQLHDSNKIIRRMVDLSRRIGGLFACALPILASFAQSPPSVARTSFDEEVTVVATTPSGGIGLPADKLPYNIQSVTADALENAQSLDLTDYLHSNLASVSINSAQGNPLQPDVQFRGYTASPLLGLPIGVAVYQNSVRINEPLGDAVNWDLLPESAVHRLSLIAGSNPLFGLNALGGALTIEMKNGFNSSGHSIEYEHGSWGRNIATVQSAARNDALGYYLNISYFDEDGWRDLSASDATNVYGAVSWRGSATELDVTGQHGNSELTGNGSAPVGLIAIDRTAIFTAPDITENRMHMLTANLRHAFSDSTELVASSFLRGNSTDSINGDISELVSCRLNNGNFLLEGLEDDELDSLGLDLGDICAAPGAGIADPDALETALNTLAGDDVFEIDDLTESVSGSGTIDHEAINNLSTRKQKTRGADMQFTFTDDLFNRGNYLVAGFAYFRGEAKFNARVELSNLNAKNRSSAGLGLGSFVDEFSTNVRTRSSTWSAFFLDVFDFNEQLSFSFGGRFNATDIKLRDRTTQRLELNGEHVFQRFNPTVGVTYSPFQQINLYAGYSESSRAPTPIELACNDGVFQIARDAAIARGEDPDEVNFECRLPNAFLADPPLDQVVANSYEFGLRGELPYAQYHLGYFHTTNRDDIIFQTTGRATGLFANVDKTLRQGVEVSASGDLQSLNWSLSYSYIDASFASDFLALSPAHDFANSDGEIQVRDGDRIPGIPEHLFKFGADYAFSFGASVGFDVIVNSDQFLRGDESNQLDKIDGYTTVDLRANYRLNDHAKVFMRVTNLFDSEYENFGLLGEDPGDVIDVLRDRRPRFLGAGAPRGVWLGFKFSI